MTPPKFGALDQFTRRTRSANKLMREAVRMVDVDEILSTETELISLTMVEEQNP
jgi:hypothetical protein